MSREMPTLPVEREAAIARLNVRQQRRNLYTNIGEREVRREVLRFRREWQRICDRERARFARARADYNPDGSKRV